MKPSAHGTQIKTGRRTESKCPSRRQCSRLWIVTKTGRFWLHLSEVGKKFITEKLAWRSGAGRCERNLRSGKLLSHRKHWNTTAAMQATVFLRMETLARSQFRRNRCFTWGSIGGHFALKSLQSGLKLPWRATLP